MNQYFQLKNDGMTIELNSDSRLNGKYVSKYKNGNIRAEGTFVNNVRTGIWTVYDSTGKKIHQRDYSQDHLSYVKLFPEKETKGPASLFDTAVYHTVKGSDGMIPYFQITERMVVYSTRIWRSIPSDYNDVLYKKNLLYKTLFNFITDSTNLSYCSGDENFTNQLPVSDLKKFSLKVYKIINWKIKEDVFYDIERNVSETRIIGICPVGVNLYSKDTSDLYWIYFPYARKALSEVKTNLKNSKGEMQTLDDLFFFRNFSSEIDKQSNARDLSLKDYCKTQNEIEEERRRIETSLIETEHEIWLGNLPK